MQKKYESKIKLHVVIQILLFIVLIAIDKITKVIVVNNLKDQQPISIIKDVLELQYLENYGAAFGSFLNKQVMFYILTAIILVAITILFVILVKKLHKYCNLITTSPDDFHFNTYNGTIFLCYLLSVLAAGAIGNLIDRITTKYVVDFIYFKIIDFPIFNFADICITLSAVFLVIYFIFINKEDKNLTIFSSKKKSDK